MSMLFTYNQLSNLLRKASLLLAALCPMLCLSSAFAQTTFKRNGLTYKAIDSTQVVVYHNPADTITLKGRLVIPSEVMNASGVNYHVVAIADSAFSGCDQVTSIYIPASVKKIGNNIIDSCFGLNAFDVDVVSKYYKVENGVLFSADGTSLVCCPTNKNGEYVFPSNVKHIEPTAFATCKNLSQITFNEGLKNIPDSAFYECWGLANVVFPESLETIGNYAFDGTILQFLYFYKNLKSIGEHAFERSSMVECICLGTEPAKLGKDAFGHEMQYTRLYVPAGCQEKYKKAGWGVFPKMNIGGSSRRWKGSYR